MKRSRHGIGEIMVLLFCAALLIWGGVGCLIDYGKYIFPEPATFAYTAPSQSSSDDATDKKEILVWVTAKGKKYHSNPNCSGMKDPYQIILEEAQDSGRGPCSKCY